MTTLVGLSKGSYDRFFHKFSADQWQRFIIALLSRFQIVTGGETVSAPVKSVLSQALNLLKVLQKKLNLSILFINHNADILGHFILSGKAPYRVKPSSGYQFQTSCPSVDEKSWREEQKLPEIEPGGFSAFWKVVEQGACPKLQPEHMNQ